MCPTCRNLNYHGKEAWYYQNAEVLLSKALNENRMTEKDVDLVKEFTHRLRADISPGRFYKITIILLSVRRLMTCQFTDLTESGLYDLQYAIKTAKFKDGEKKGKLYSQNTRADWMKTSKRFYIYLSKHRYTSIPYETLRELKTGTYSRQTKTEDDVLTADEVNKLIANAMNERDRCYLSMLYETGARSIELANLKWSEITFQDWGALITLTDYKGNGLPKSRTVPVIVYAKYLYEWRNLYIQRYDDSGDRWVFTNKFGDPLTYATANKILKDCVTRAKIQRHVSLHRFRHSRITHVLREGMNETIAKKSFWGNLNTPMIETYCHLSTNDVASAYLNLAGFEEEKVEVNETPKSVQCPKCQHISPPGTYFCPICGTGLVKHLVEDVESAQHAIEERMMRMTDKEKIEFAAFLEGYRE